MNIQSAASTSRTGTLAILLWASAFAVPAFAQVAPSAGNTPATPPAAAPVDSSAAVQEQPVPYSAAPVKEPKEGFWGRVNPFARKKWVKQRLDPINDQLNELDEVNAKNARDIRDMDARAQAGIRKAQNAADAANQTATAAGEQARQANSIAQDATNHVDNLTTTVNGLDQYDQKSTVDIAFPGGQPTLTGEARKRLDDLAAELNGQAGYILELKAHSPASGSTGIQNSERLAEAVERYLVTAHNLPIYRIHAVALGNARGTAEGDEDKPVRHSSVHIRLLVNSLGTQAAVAPHATAFLSTTAQP